MLATLGRPIAILMLATACTPNASTIERSLLNAPELRSVYETSETSRRSSDSRIDFMGKDALWSGIDYTAEERSRAETGGLIKYGETGLYYSVSPPGVVIPKRPISEFQAAHLECRAKPLSHERKQIDCMAKGSGKTYTTVYSQLRGVESFQMACLDGDDEICTYFLKSGIGLLSETMIATLRKKGVLGAGTQPGRPN